MLQTHYHTISQQGTGEYKEKGSKFVAYAQPVSTEDAVKAALENIKSEHLKARHWCYAYRMEADGSLYRANDDGEPSGTAGRPILGQIDSLQLTNTLVTVVRYFGGVKLGTSGLIHAYKTAAALALEQCNIIEVPLMIHSTLRFGNHRISEVMRLIKQVEGQIKSQNYEKDAWLVAFELPVAQYESLEQLLSPLYDVEATTTS
ncbi:MAG: YigZ family protein [Bacteroidetes bacterium]|nr:YigZ family protein [Bacteroidota bacterium]MCB9042982.1 YigZ family protein [Chitinophagales bacterium]